MKSVLVTVALLASSAAAAAIRTPLLKRSVDYPWGDSKSKVRGVNIGGWLVLEPWITPALFQQFSPAVDTVDEWTLNENHAVIAGGDLKKHWDTWVSLSDFQFIKYAGFNTVRIPIGYWAFQKFNDPYTTGAQHYLDLAIGWARTTGLKIWIDLHGAPGSQNGYDNSGHNGTIGWGEGTTVSDTRTVIRKIAKQYAAEDYQDVVVAIELLNEPLAQDITGGVDTVVDFYNNAYGDVRTVSDTPVILHDAFQTSGTFWNGVLSQSGSNVIIDHHEYQIFTPELIDKNIDEHIEFVMSNAKTYASNVGHWVVVGEWSAALTDCAPALNGYGLGSRWEGSFPRGSTLTGRSCGTINYIDQWNQTTKDDTSRYIKAQIDTYESLTQGWVFWNFKTTASAEWDLERLLNHGIFPNMTSYTPMSLVS